MFYVNNYLLFSINKNSLKYKRKSKKSSCIIFQKWACSGVLFGKLLPKIEERKNGTYKNSRDSEN
ncbi:hypothetical protein D7Y41_16805 [Anaerotruncus sp. 1XD22-93]|nr:hypothetical protein D7Y41_16805 [Anaerotruncus sp. 1XD22-93]